MQLSFNSGALWGTRTDQTVPTPIRFGNLQDVSVDFTGSLKGVYGRGQLALALARGTIKVSGKAKTASLQGNMINDLFFNGTRAVGQIIIIEDEGLSAGGTAIPVTPFQIVVANGANFIEDLGVINAATGLPLTKVASAPAAGQYSCTPSTGTYLFSTADNVAGVKVAISYTYTKTGSGTLITMTNNIIGVTPTFKMYLSGGFSSKVTSMILNSCVSAKLGIATKMEDFVQPDFDFECSVDGSNTLGTLSLGE